MLRRSHEVKENIDAFLRSYPHTLLSKVEEQRIAALPLDHPERWKLVQHNMRYAVQICISFYNRNKLVNDFNALLGVAEDAMIYVALKKFKAVGADFVGYAKWYLRRDIMREIHRQLCIVRLPTLSESNRASLREACDYEVSLNTQPEEFHEQLDRGPRGEVIDTSPIDSVDGKLNLEIERLIKRDWDRRIVRMYYGLDGNEPMTLAEISGVLQVVHPQTTRATSEEGIRQVLKRCRHKLSKSKSLKELVG
jgi:DNA-directed RNA polymerase sigma subunit (sigma70/sigma32)